MKTYEVTSGGQRRLEGAVLFSEQKQGEGPESKTSNTKVKSGNTGESHTKVKSKRARVPAPHELKHTGYCPRGSGREEAASSTAARS